MASSKQSRGHVKIYSEVGHGTRIKLYLPRAAVAAEEAAAPARRPRAASCPAARRSSWSRTTTTVRKVAVRMLRGLGYQVREAEDGPSALAILKEPGQIDLLFTDLIMPNGIERRGTPAAPARLRPGLKALFTSGYSEHFMQSRGSAGRGRAAAQQALPLAEASPKRCAACSTPNRARLRAACSRHRWQSRAPRIAGAPLAG